jgi:hypothetical protein
MSASPGTCHNFIANAWRKEICSNCFRLRDEHNSVKDSSPSISNNKNNGTLLNNMNSSIHSSKSSQQQQQPTTRYQSPYGNIPRISPSREKGPLSPSRDSTPSPHNHHHYYSNNSNAIKSGQNRMTGMNKTAVVVISQTNNNSNNKLTHHGSQQSQSQARMNNRSSSTSSLSHQSGLNGPTTPVAGGIGIGIVGGVSVNGVTVGNNNNNQFNNAAHANKSAVRQQQQQVVLKTMDSADGNAATALHGSRKPRFNVGNKKGILKSKEAKPRRMNVSFPEQVSEIQKNMKELYIGTFS